MNAELLLKYYDRIADAPDAIARLRRFVLDLAVRGKLVPQDASDETASELLKRIETEKARLQKLGKIKRQEPLPDVTDADPPFDVPKGWAATRLAVVAVCLDYMRKPINGTERDQRVAEKPQSDLFPYFGATQQQGWIDDYIFDEELVLLGEDGVPFFDPLRAKAYLIAGKSWVNNHAHVFRGIFVSHPFLVHCLNVFDYSGRVVGATRSKLNQARAIDIPIILPPLAEQRRIVAKVDELMALCDRLETARGTREATRDRLAAASLARLNAPDPESFQADARFALGTLPALTTRPDQIKQLRQTILNLAVRGKLVTQDARDEPIDVTLRKALARRAALVRAKKVRQKKIDGYDDLAIDVELPPSWAIERLGNLVDPENTISYGVLVPGEDVSDGVPFVRAQDLALSSHPERPNKTISPEIEKAYARTRLRGGEILVCVVGSIGKLGVVPQSWAGANIARAVARIAPIPEISREYLLVVLRGEPVQTYFSETTRTLAQPTLNVGLIEQTPIPLPPLTEQHRIVAKVDELMALCDRLEASLTAATATRRRLLDALLAEALAPVAENGDDEILPNKRVQNA